MNRLGRRMTSGGSALTPQLKTECDPPNARQTMTEYSPTDNTDSHDGQTIQENREQQSSTAPDLLQISDPGNPALCRHSHPCPRHSEPHYGRAVQ